MLINTYRIWILKNVLLQDNKKYRCDNFGGKEAVLDTSFQVIERSYRRTGSGREFHRHGKILEIKVWGMRGHVYGEGIRELKISSDCRRARNKAFISGK